MQLTAQQQQAMHAIEQFMQSDVPVFILKGYAGTGKTTLIQQIADYVEQVGHLPLLMAPTGRAAAVLKEKSGREASTIHRQIYSSYGVRTNCASDIADTQFKILFPLASANDKIVAIVDEASMLCSRKMEHEIFVFGTDNLMNDLLSYIRTSFCGKIIFVGDPAQLPPVGESESNALSECFFQERGMQVMSTELTEVLRQNRESAILQNAMMIRDLLHSTHRNSLQFTEHSGDVEYIAPEHFLDRYVDLRKASGVNNCVAICFTNKSTHEYNKRIRQMLYGAPDIALSTQDILMVVQNNYLLHVMNGELIPVLSIGESVQREVPVYVEQGGTKQRKIITLKFLHIKTLDYRQEPCSCLLLLNLLESNRPTLTNDEHRALFINFCIMHSNLKQNTPEFTEALKSDPYYNSLKAKYGYAVTGHKCQGGEWDYVFVDYTQRTGLDDDCLRWAYTATTRAHKCLYVTNLPHITPFSKFRIDAVERCAQVNEECRIIGEVALSPFHKPTDPRYLHAKQMCISCQMEGTPYHIAQIISKPYLEIYQIATPDGTERYDLHYKKGGIFLPATPQCNSRHTAMVCQMLNNEGDMPLCFDYHPTDKLHENLFNLIRSACDSCVIQLTNVVEHPEEYSTIFYMRTSGTYSYIKIYIDKSGFITYAKPMSMLGREDHELNLLIEELHNHLK